MTEPIRVRVFCRTSIYQSDVEDFFEVEPDEVEGMSEQERAAYIEKIAYEMLFDGSMFEWGWDDQSEAEK